MFKNYLSYSFAQNFHRSCTYLPDFETYRTRLVQSSSSMLSHFTESLYSKDPKDEAKHLFVSLTCLRDCREILEQAQSRNEVIWNQFHVLHERLEQICYKLADQEGGQTRMLG